MAIFSPRQYFLPEDSEFNLGMNADAFMNLGMPELAALQNEGLMSLAGANESAANPAAVANLIAQTADQNAVSAPATTAKDLFDYYATDFTPNQTALDFWNNKINTLGYESALNQFLDPEDRYAPRTAAMFKDPDYLKIRPANEMISAEPAGGVMGLSGVTPAGVADVVQTAAVPKTQIPTVPVEDQPPPPEPIVDAAPARVAETIADVQSPYVTQAQELFDKYATGFDPGQEGLNFWAEQLSKPGATPESVLQEFLNPDVGANAPRTFYLDVDPDAVAARKAAQPKVDATNFPKFEGTPYDPKSYDTLVKQLTNQQKVLSEKLKIPYESTFGGAPETIQDMAKRLASLGISNLSDFGMRYEAPVEKVYETIDSDEGPSMTFDTGKYRIVTGQTIDQEGNIQNTYRELTDSEAKRLKNRDGMAILDIKRDEVTPQSQAVYYNKKTGEVLDTRKVGGKAAENIWGSSGAGDGYTDYRVMFDSKGNPVFLPKKELSGLKEFIVDDLSGILQVASFIPGAQIPVMIAQAAAAAHMGVDPKDILKNLAVSYLASNVGKLGNKVLPELGFDLPTSDLGKMALDAGYSGLASLIKGGDIESAIKSGVLSAAGSGISKLMPETKVGEFDYGKAIRALAPALADGKLSNSDIFRLVSTYAKDQAREEAKQKKTPGKP